MLVFWFVRLRRRNYFNYRLKNHWEKGLVLRPGPLSILAAGLPFYAHAEMDSTDDQTQQKYQQAKFQGEKRRNAQFLVDDKEEIKANIG